MQRRSILLLSLALGLMLGAAVPARGSQTVWSGLVIANNAAEPEETPIELKRVEGTLKELFGYNQFSVIGQSKKALVTGSEDWMAQSKYFSLHVDSKEGNDKNGYRLHLKLYQGKRPPSGTEAKPGKTSSANHHRPPGGG